MLKERARALAALVFTTDLLLTSAGFLLAWWTRAVLLPAWMPGRFPAFYPLREYLPLLPLVLGIWGTLFVLTGLYRSHRTVPLADEARVLLRVGGLGLVFFALAIYAFRLDDRVVGSDEISRLFVALVGAWTTFLLIAEKLAVRTLSRYVRSRGLNYRTVLIVGSNPGAIEIADSIRSHRYWGFRILGFVTRDGEAGSIPPPYRVLGPLDRMIDIVEEHPVDDVLFCVSRRDLDRMEDLFLALHEQGIRTRFALNLFPHVKAKTRMEELDGVPLITFSTTPESVMAMFWKRSLDVSISLLLISLSFPIVALLAGAIKLTSRGAVLYRQTRCGLNGRRFTLYKLRTMVEDAEKQLETLEHLNEMDGPVFKVRRDPRITPLGRFLRRWSLDELPQLFNVLRGDMSLVGPRPPIPSEVARYQRWQRRRLSMKPGLTCLWQISGRNHLDFDRWMELDLEYIDSWTPWLDIKILLRTVPAVLTGRGAF